MSADVSSTPSPGIDWGAIAAELSAAASSGGPAAEPSGVADVPDGQVTKDVNAAGTPDNQADNGNKPAVPVAEVFTPAQIAQLAREEREARELKAKLDAELKALEPVKGELETLRAKVKEAGSRFKEDPAGVLEDAGVPPEQWLEIAELLFFSVDPSKASPDLQYKLNNRKQERRLAKMEAELNARLQAAEEARQREAQEAPVRAIIASLEAYAMAAPAEKYPATRAWFESDNQALAQTYVNTAANLAEAAHARGEVFKPDPDLIAKEVESYFASKFAKFRPAAPVQASAKAPAATASTPAGLERNSARPEVSQDDDSVEAREQRAAMMLEEIMRSKR